MADQISMSLEDVNALADKLDALDDQLNDDEKTLLLAVFRVAGAAIEPRTDESEVEGFAFGSPGFGMPSPVPLSQGFRNAFSPGVGGDPGRGQTIIIGGGADPDESIGLGRGIH
jgi:hypothetical protein